jgi:hypothetical protein
MLIALFCPVISAASTGKPMLSESTAKATLLYQLLNFIEWPHEGNRDHLRVCMGKNTSLDDAVTSQLTGKVIAGRPVELRFVERPAQVVDCAVLFLPGSDVRSLKPMLAAAGPNTLTVGDSLAILPLHGMLSIVLGDLRLELYLNRSTLYASAIQLSPQLLRLAKEWRQK